MMKARFARKPCDLDNALQQIDFSKDAEPIRLQSIRHFTATQYDAFAEQLLAPWEFLAGCGGVHNGHRLVVKISAPDRRTLYIDPSGSNYARYVGFADET